jgi:hypothetical protein
MKLRLLILLAAAALAAAPAAGQTIKSLGYNTTNGNIVAATNVTFTNSVGFATNARAATRTNLGLGKFSVSEDDIAGIFGETRNALQVDGDDLQIQVPMSFYGTNTASTTRTNLGLGATNAVTFGTVEISNDEMLINGSSIQSGSFGGTFDFEERRLLQGETAIFTYGSNSATVSVPATFSTNVSIAGSLTATGNATLNGVNNTMPNATTASSASSLMTRELSDARYSFSRWYSAADLLYLEQSTGIPSVIRGNDTGFSPLSAQMVVVPDVNTKWSLPIDYRVGGQVRVVSYWTDRILTNSGGTNADIAVWTFPSAVQPTSNTISNNITQGTQIKTVYTANYGGTGNSRYYVVDQLVDFGTITNISATNPMQIKYVELQRRAADATDTSTNTIYLSGVHIYVP